MVSVLRLVEKPTYHYNINTGIYVLSPECVSSVAKNTKVDLPTLLADRMEQDHRVGIYTSYDYWLDIGQIADYHKAQNDIKGFI